MRIAGMATVKARATSIDRLVNPVIKAAFTVLGAPVILAAKLEKQQGSSERVNI
jgi:hypothetical protein